MPDLSPLSDEQRAALREHEMALLVYKEAVTRRIEAEQAEREALFRVERLLYDIAGAK